MKLSKKFLEDLHKIGEWSFVEKNMWIGKLVPEIIVDNLQKRGISQEDVEGCVVLTVEEAKRLHDCAMFFWDDYEGTQYFTNDDKRFLTDMRERIEQAEKSYEGN